MFGGFAHGHDIADEHRIFQFGQETLGLHLVFVAKHSVNFGHGRVAIGVQLHSAAGRNNMGGWVFSA